jgi:hypothetical protein
LNKAAIAGFARSQSADKVTRNLTDFTKVSFGVPGSGDISYLGSPKIDARVSGSGKVRSR